MESMAKQNRQMGLPSYTSAQQTLLILASCTVDVSERRVSLYICAATKVTPATSVTFQSIITNVQKRQPIKKKQKQKKNNGKGLIGPILYCMDIAWMTCRYLQHWAKQSLEQFDAAPSLSPVSLVRSLTNL